MQKSFIIALFTFSVTLGFGQENPPVPETNTVILNTNQTATPQVLEEVESEEEMLDSLAVTPVDKETEKVVLSKKKAKGAVRSRNAKLEAVPAYEGAEMEDESVEMDADMSVGSAVQSEQTIQSAQIQQATYKFSASKGRASEQRLQRSPTLMQQMEMDQAVGTLEASAPNSFEYHYFKYVSGNYDVSLVSNLKAAEALRPNNADVHVQLAAYNIIKRNSDSAKVYVSQLIASGRLESNVLHYGEDILASVPNNWVLITHGFDDTYSVWKKQNIDGQRTDVKLISLDFLQSEYYRNKLKSDGFKLPQSQVVNVQYLNRFCELNSGKGLSISMTTPKEYFEPLKSKLYVTGLVFEYHEKEFNNFERNDDLWNKGLSKHLIDNATDEKSQQLSSNYLPMLLQLRKVYKQKEEIEKFKEVDAAVDKVGLQCKKYDQVQRLKKSY